MRVPDYFPLQGGLNLTTPSVRTPKGHAIAAENYQPVERGYRRFDGFERFDGRPSPSAASYWVLHFDAGTAAITAGQIVTGATSSASGEALVNAVVESGSYGGSDAAGYLVLFNVSGTFQNNENLQVAAATKSVANLTATERGATNDTDDTTWYRAAVAATRADILAVPGSGPLRGVWQFDGDRYAFRDNAGATAGVMFKSTTAGWVAQALGRRLNFTSGGVTEIVTGNTITGATSAATALITRVVLQSGTWGGGDAAGYLIFASQTGTFQAENIDVGAALNLATIGGDSSAITLPPGGRYEFDNYNFFGASNLRRMYGCNGVGNAFEWDGTVFVPIVTGMATDTPKHIIAHKNHLFLAFVGGSVQHSGIGNPYSWSPVLGASEIGIGTEITNFATYAKSLIIFGRNVIAELSGSDSSDFLLNPLSDETGAVEWTAQRMIRPIYLDVRGLRDLIATQDYGDFKMGTISQLIEPFMAAKRKAGIYGIASMRVRGKDQYRLFFSDGTGVAVYMGRKTPEIMPFNLGMVVRCCCSVRDDDESVIAADEALLFGSDDGYVYEMDKGTSFDGAEIAAFCRLAFNHSGSPTQSKRYHLATLEVDAVTGTQLRLSAEFSHGNPLQPPAAEQTFDVMGGGGFWNGVNWNDFLWSTAVEGKAACRIKGHGENISVAVVSTATHEQPHTMHGLTLHMTRRRMLRG